ncbi:MAG: GTP-binding protein [Bacteroidales bacterium]|nr:GTP-binding protein [Bacteroidales bacterium]MBN2819704.1 GTP-binding protein [Bacteroidales bacterium]
MSEFQDKQDGYLNMELLRFTTAGSVDDGKSTLIGRLLYDSKAIFEDQMEAIERASINKGEEHVNLALLTDGLRAEREQGITIDVAYRYFATPKRKFIIADTPGHVQYTRNMVTGASTANAAIILVDARNGVVEQTIRHSFIASLLQIPHVIICINKMDLVDYKEEVYEKIRKDYNAVSDKLNVKDVRFVPISALKGDNVVDRSERMPWYDGTTLLYLLEHLHIKNDRNFNDKRFPVQYVVRPQKAEWHDYRGYAGRVAGGVFKPGDDVTILPAGLSSKVKTIDMMGAENMASAFPPQSVTITLEDDIDISRGDMIVAIDDLPSVGQDITFKFCWLSEKELMPNAKYTLRHTTKEVKCVIKSVDYKIDINTLEKITGDKSVRLNEIGKMTIRTTQPLIFDSYEKNKITGCVILVDDATNNTICAGMIV